MKQKNKQERLLGYTTAQVIQKEELNQVNGGSNAQSFGFTTKFTMIDATNYDFSADYQW